MPKEKKKKTYLQKLGRWCLVVTCAFVPMWLVFVIEQDLKGDET